MTVTLMELLVTQLKPILLAIGAMVVLCGLIIYLFRNQIALIFLRRTPRYQEDGEADNDFPKRRYEDRVLDDILEIAKRAVDAQEKNSVQLASLAQQLASLSESIHELRVSIQVTNGRIDTILLGRGKG